MMLLLHQGRQRRQQQRWSSLLLVLLGLASLSDAWQLPFAQQHRRQHQLQHQQLQQQQHMQMQGRTGVAPMWAAPSTTKQPAAVSGGGGGDDNEEEKKKAKQQQAVDDAPMDAGKLLEVLRGLIMRPFEGEWEAWAQQEKEVARALRAELKGQGEEMEAGVKKERGEEGGEEEGGAQEESASEVSMKVLSTLEELTPEVRGVLEEAIATVRAQEAEAREKVAAELSELRAQQRQYIAEREEELEVVEGYADQIKDLTRAAARKEGEVQQLRRNLKEVQNIRRDLAYRLEQSQKAVDGMQAESRAKIEELQRQLTREQAAVEDLQSREAALTKERDTARAEAKALVAAMAAETGGMAAEGAAALERRLQELVEAVGVKEEYDSAVVGGGRDVVGARARDAWASWYDKTFREVEAKVEAVGAAADEAVAGMRGQVEGMRREVEAADQRVREARAEAQGALRVRDEWEKKAARADMEREAVEENARLLQSLYDEETARFEAAMYKMMRRLKEDEAAAGKIQEAGRIEREQLQRDYEARLKAKEAALAAATEGKELLARRLDEELQAKAEALSSLDARLQEESRAREAAQTRLTAFEKKAAELQASVKQLGVERREVERQYGAKLSSERNLRLQEQVEWQRRIDKVRTEEMAAVADMQQAQEDARRIARELQGAQSSLSTYEQERGSVRAILRLLVRVVLDKVRRRRRGRGQIGEGEGEQGQGQGLIDSDAGSSSSSSERERYYEEAAYEKARLYAQRTVERAKRLQSQAKEIEEWRGEELQQLLPPKQQQEGGQEGS